MDNDIKFQDEVYVIATHRIYAIMTSHAHFFTRGTGDDERFIYKDEAMAKTALDVINRLDPYGRECHIKEITVRVELPINVSSPSFLNLNLAKNINDALQRKINRLDVWGKSPDEVPD